mmetsp:Transcript_9416/g.15783  ORF Transcript_9416/g.15783 Transcript_9416/m.15783 type:complete len:108 (-) Transcript_9416:363-686(-)
MVRKELLRLNPQASMPFGGDLLPISSTQESLRQSHKNRPIKIQDTLTKPLMNSRFLSVLTRDEGVVAAAAWLTAQDKARMHQIGRRTWLFFSLAGGLAQQVGHPPHQ